MESSGRSLYFSINDLRDRVTNQFLSIFVAALWGAILLVAHRVPFMGLHPYFILQCAIALTATFVWIFRKHLRQNTIVLGMAVALASLFVMGTLSFGLMTSAMLLPPCLAMFLILLGHKRVAYASIASTAIFLAAACYLFTTGTLKPLIAPNVYLLSPYEWILALGVSVSVSLLMVLPFQIVPQTLASSEQRFRTAFENANEGVCLVGIDGKFLQVNKALCEMLGYKREELLERKFNDITLPEDRAIGETFINGALTQGDQQGRFEKRYLDRNGQILWVLIATSLVEDSSGQPSYFISHIQNITERKRFEQELSESEKKYRTLFNSASDAILLMKDGTFVDCNESTLAMFRGSKGQIVGRRPEEFSPKFQPDHRPSESKALEKINAALTGHPQLFEWRHQRLDGLTFDAEVSLNRLELSPDSPDLLAIVRDITQRKKEEQALRESEERFQKIFHASPAPMSISRLRDGTYIDVNESFLKAMEFERSEVIGKSALELNTWADIEERNTVTEILRRKGSVRNFEGKHRTKSGKIGHSIVSAELVELENESIILGVTLDITERKKAEEALRRERNLLRTLIDSLPKSVFVFTVDSQRRYVINNLAHLKSLGANRQEDVIGKSAFDFHDAQLAQEYDLDEREVMRTGRPLINKKEVVHDRNNGIMRFYLTNKVPIRDSSGNITGLVGMSTDITEQKYAEDALRESEEKFSKVFMASPAGISLSSLETGRLLEINLEFEKVFGFTREEILGHTSLELGLWIDPKDRNDYIRTVTASDKVVETTLRLRAKDGRVLILRTNAQLVELQGTQLLISTFADVTQQMLAEESLRQSEARYRALVENTPDIIARFGRDHRYLFVNTAIQKVSRLKPDEFVGKTLWNVGFSPEQAQERDRLIQQILDTGKGVEAELGFDAPTGRQIYEWRGFPEFDPSGTVQSVLSINREITERKLAEQNLRSSMEQLHALTQRLEQIREEERKTIAHDVHDQLGQILTALRMDLTSIKSINPSQAIEFEERMKGVIDLTDSAIENVQQIAARLRPGMLDYLGLLAAMEWQIEEFQKRSGVQCFMQFPETEPSLDSDRATALFRILQETLTNVARHAKARKVRIILSESNDQVTMSISDDGLGIAPAQLEDPKSLGLLGMRERLHPFQGLCTITCPPEGGTVVTVVLPIRPASR